MFLLGGVIGRFKSQQLNIVVIYGPWLYQIDEDPYHTQLNEGLHN